MEKTKRHIANLCIAIIPALCGFSLVGEHTDFFWFTIIYDFLFYMLTRMSLEVFE